MVSVSATLDGDSVNIVGIDNNGKEIYLRYLDTFGNLKMKHLFRDDTIETGFIIATNATAI